MEGWCLKQLTGPRITPGGTPSIPGILQLIPAAKADWRGSRGKGTPASSMWLQAHTLPITYICAGPEELKQEAIPQHLLQPTARHNLLFLVEPESGEGSLQVSHPGEELLTEVAGCTTPHSRVGRLRLLGLWQWGMGGLSTSTPPCPPTCRAPCHQGFPQAAGVKFSLTPTQRVQPPNTTPPHPLPSNTARGFLLSW